MSYKSTTKWMWCDPCDEEWEAEFLDTGEAYEERLEHVYSWEEFCPICDRKGEFLILEEDEKYEKDDLDQLNDPVLDDEVENSFRGAPFGTFRIKK